jgi:uncharacterized protein
VTLLYNLIMAAVDLAAVWLLHQKRTPRRWFAVLCGAAAAAMILAVLLGFARADHFAVLRLAAYGIYLHGVLLLAVSGGLLWKGSRRLAGSSLLIAVVLLGVAGYAFRIEPHWLDVTHRQFASDKVVRPLKIVVVADIQTDHVGDYEREVFRRVAEERPDLLLFSGDYVQAPWADRNGLWAGLRPQIREVVENGLAPGGRAFAVRGNVDWHDWDRMFDGLGVQTVNATQSIELEPLGLTLTCLSWTDSIRTEVTVARPRPGRFHIVMGHSPNFALGPIDADLLVAGHTHGGQVRLPWIGPLITHASVPHSWAAGQTELPGGGTLLVSRGLGMERGHAPQLRFNCRPELMVIELLPQKPAE